MELRYKLQGSRKGSISNFQIFKHLLKRLNRSLHAFIASFHASSTFFVNPKAFKGFIILKWHHFRGIGLSSSSAIMHSLQDIDEIIDIKVHQRTIELEDSKKQLESFSYFVAHDLKAPLRVINGYCTIIKNSPHMSDEDRIEMMGYVADSANKMNALIDGLLRLAKVDSQRIEKSKIDMGLMVGSVLDDLRDTSLLRPRIVMRSLPDACGDTWLIRQVWVNLISNAIKYSGKNNQAVIEIGSRLHKGKTVYYVRDNGSGFDMKFSDKLFAAFHRLHSEEDFQGTGVGLALVHRIIAKHGGNIWAHAKVNEGATFYFTL